MKFNDVNSMLKSLNLNFDSLSEHIKDLIKQSLIGESILKSLNLDTSSFIATAQKSILLERVKEHKQENFKLQMENIRLQIQINQTKIFKFRNATKLKKIKALFVALKSSTKFDDFNIQKIVNTLINQLEIFKIALHFTDTTQINKNILTQTTYYKTITKRP